MSRKMKNSGIDWIQEIPIEWSVGKVKQAFIRQNSNAMQENPVVLSLARSGVKIRDISNNEGQLAASYFNYNPVRVGDFLLNPMDLYSGANCNVSKVSGVISPAYFNLRAKDGFVSQYYDYYFKIQYWAMALFAHGKGVSFDNRWTLNTNTLMNYYIPVPRKQEQQQISNFLDQKVSEIDHIIDETKLSIEEYKKYKQSLITEVVTKGLNPDVKMKDSGIAWIGEIPEHWKITRPNRACEIIRGNSGFQKNDMKNEGDYVAIQYGLIYKVDEVDETFKYYIDESFYKNNQLVRKDDTILVSTSETMEDLGHSCFYNRHDYGLLGGEQMCLKPNELNIVGKFLYYATTYFKYELNRYATGLKVFRFRLDDLKKINIIIPPIDEQNRIINFLDKKIPLIDNVVLSKETLLTELESYKKSLIYECVTGKREVI